MLQLCRMIFAQFLKNHNDMFSNLKLDSEKLDLELRYPFQMMTNTQAEHIWRG